MILTPSCLSSLHIFNLYLYLIKTKLAVRIYEKIGEGDRFLSSLYAQVDLLIEERAALYKRLEADKEEIVRLKQKMVFWTSALKQEEEAQHHEQRALQEQAYTQRMIKERNQETLTATKTVSMLAYQKIKPQLHAHFDDIAHAQAYLRSIVDFMQQYQEPQS